MSLVRTALRMAALNALKGATDSSGPTIAANRVYDSRISDFSPETYIDDAKPTVIILTDEDTGDALSMQNGGPPFRRRVDLVFEFAMVKCFDVPTGDGGTEFVPGYPATDSEHEASLDLLEYQIIKRLAYDPDSKCALFRSISRAWKYDCHRQVMDESGVTIAARVLTWQVEVTDDQVKVYNPAVDDIPTGLDILPEPLRKIAYASTGTARATCEALAAKLSPMQAEVLDGIDMQVDAEGEEDPNDMLDVSIEIRSAMETPITVASSGVVTLDYAKGTFQILSLAANVTDLQVVNWPKNGKTGRLIIKTVNTGSFSIDWPPNTIWAGGDVGQVTLGAGKIDLFVLTTASEGAEIFGNIIGQDYSA